MIEHVLEVADDQGRHLEKIDILVQPLNTLPQGAHFRFQSGAFIDELLGLISKGSIIFLEFSEIVISGAGEVPIVPVNICTHDTQHDYRPTLLKKLDGFHLQMHVKGFKERDHRVTSDGRMRTLWRREGRCETRTHREN